MAENYIEPTDLGTLRITKAEKHPEGYWTANVTINGFTATFHNRHGSWMTNVGKEGKMREAKRSVAEALSARIRPKQKAQAKEEEAAVAAAGPEESAAGSAAAPAAKPRLTTSSVKMEKLFCKPGDHEWERIPRRGRKPIACPDHMGKPAEAAPAAAPPPRKNPKRQKKSA